MRFNSIRFKISILYTAVLGIILIVYSTFLYLSLQYVLYDELDNELNIKVQKIGSTIGSYMNILGHDQKSFRYSLSRTINFEEEHPDRYKEEELEEIEKEWLRVADKLDLREDYIIFLSQDGKDIINSGNIPKGTLSFLLKSMKTGPNGKIVFKNIKYEKRNLRAIIAPFSYKENGQYIIQIGASLKPIIHLLQIRLFHIGISILAILLITSFLGRLFAARILKPVVEITKTASSITHEDLSARVKTEHVDEETRYLVDAFNEMISRLEKSFKYIAEFSSHVSHELKTPLAIMRGELELALRKEQNSGEYKRAIEACLEEAGRMLNIVEDLLLLTKLDYRSQVFKFERLDLTEFFREVYIQAEMLASHKNIAVNIDLPQKLVYVKADRLHLRRLFFNIINNAIKFNIQNGKVGIIVKQDLKDKKAIISISDTGIGIEEEDLPRVFERFFHKDRADQDVDPGNGLGLSIAQSIAKIHYGYIEVKSKPANGSTFTVTLPLA